MLVVVHKVISSLLDGAVVEAPILAGLGWIGHPDRTDERARDVVFVVIRALTGAEAGLGGSRADGRFAGLFFGGRGWLRGVASLVSVLWCMVRWEGQSTQSAEK